MGGSLYIVWTGTPCEDQASELGLKAYSTTCKFYCELQK